MPENTSFARGGKFSKNIIRYSLMVPADALTGVADTVIINENEPIMVKAA